MNVLAIGTGAPWIFDHGFLGQLPCPPDPEWADEIARYFFNCCKEDIGNKWASVEVVKEDAGWLKFDGPFWTPARIDTAKAIVEAAQVHTVNIWMPKHPVTTQGEVT